MSRRRTNDDDKLVAEQLAEYLVTTDAEEASPEVLWTTRLSAKNQITLPVAITRTLDLRAGDELSVIVLTDGSINIEKKLPPEKHAERLRGSLRGVPGWGSAEEIDAWIERERDSWDR